MLSENGSFIKQHNCPEGIDRNELLSVFVNCGYSDAAALLCSDRCNETQQLCTRLRDAPGVDTLFSFFTGESSASVGIHRDRNHEDSPFTASCCSHHPIAFRRADYRSTRSHIVI